MADEAKAVPKVNFTKGQKLTVFSIRNIEGSRAGEKGTIWVRAGRAFVNSDGSLNLILDVLPMDGRLHVRPETPQDAKADAKADAKVEPSPESTSQTEASAA